MSHWPCVKLNAHTASMSAIEAGQKERDETETVSAMASLSMQQPTNLTYVAYHYIKARFHLFPPPSLEISKDSLAAICDFSELLQNIPEKFPRSRWNRTTPNEERRETGRRSCIDVITRLSLRSNLRFSVERLSDDD